MAYSRWSDNHFYSFWQESYSNCMDEQCLSLWTRDLHQDFTFVELQHVARNTLREIYGDISELDLDEALRIIKLFMTDVADEFTPVE